MTSVRRRVGHSPRALKPASVAVAEHMAQNPTRWTAWTGSSLAFGTTASSQGHVTSERLARLSNSIPSLIIAAATSLTIPRKRLG